MAKKTTSRSNAEPKSDAMQASASPKPRSRSRSAKTTQSDAPVAMADDRATSVADVNGIPTTSSADTGLTLLEDRARASATNGSGESTSVSMASEPSEEDIRMRAYHRYLERGAGHGLDFDDWVEAERELRDKA